jgi:hypothetical protein
MPTNPKEYTNLRTLLDSLEVGALRYYLSGSGLSQPQKFRYLQDTLMPIINDLWHQQQAKGVMIECPDGYFDCNGCCVPYKCPDVSQDKPKKSAKSAKRKS